MKRAIQYTLDAIMALVLAVLYQKQAVSMAFHEIAGLALGGMALIHLLLNTKWVVAMTRRVFSPRTTGRAKLLYIVDALCLVSFAAMILSGALISKVVFTGSAQGGAWKTVHYASAAYALFLMGVHLGLHASLIRKGFAKATHLRGKARAAVGAVLIAALCAYGVYGFATTGYLRWAAMPFSTQQAGGHGAGEGNGGGKRVRSEQTETVSDTPTADAGQGDETRMRTRENAGGMPNGNTVNAGRILSTLCTYGAMMACVGCVVAVLDALRRKRKGPLERASSAV